MLATVNGHVVRSLKGNFVMGFDFNTLFGVGIETCACLAALDIETAEIGNGHLAVSLGDVVGYTA